MDFLSKEWFGLVRDGARAFDVILDQEQLSLMGAYGAELVRWNKKTNLTAITEPKEVALKHFVDSTAAVRYIKGGSRVIDLGAGGGFPGIPLKICNPDLDITLVDASRKKVSFMKQVIRELKLTGIDAVHSRVEDLALDPRYATSFDVVISRAFTELKRFVELGMPFLAEGGVILAMKGAPSKGEIAAFKAVSFEFASGLQCSYNDLDIEIEKYPLPVVGSDRAIYKISGIGKKQ